MSIDERLDRLVERHEALAETVQIVARMQQAAERRQQEAERQAQEADRRAQGRDAIYTERFAANEVRLAQLMDTMNRLGRILEIHDAEIDDHGRRLENLEH
ncbi:MAG TPA: hypothetical protein VMT86_02605 [Bryobacteraceae bacterium]|nr:hypothetical protein [Bryobacteraceae bacterium]